MPTRLSCEEPARRQANSGTRQGRTLWFTGLPSSGKSTLAHALGKCLADASYPVEVLDGDVVRTHLSRDLGFSRADRDENVRRVGFVADLLSRNGVFALCSLVSPYRAVREELRSRHGGRFFEVFVATPLEVCVSRDVKGLYAKQRAGIMAGLTGVDDPYEPPENPDLIIHAHRQSIEESVDLLWKALFS